MEGRGELHELERKVEKEGRVELTARSVELARTSKKAGMLSEVRCSVLRVLVAWEGLRKKNQLCRIRASTRTKAKSLTTSATETSDEADCSRRETRAEARDCQREEEEQVSKLLVLQM